MDPDAHDAEPDRSTDLHLRTHGAAGPTVVLLHGGPAAAGSLGPLARELAGTFRVIEPFQRESGAESLTVARHIADLQQVIERRCGDGPPLIVGHSWGAMLALTHAAVHPKVPAALFLIGSGTFDLASRARMREILEARTDDALRRRLKALDDDIADPSARRLQAARLTQPISSYELIDQPPDEEERFDLRAHRETWNDMIRLQEAGLYPAAFAAVTCPVVMLHGADDPHPGPMIRDNLRTFLPHLRYVEWPRCGHYPWLERAAREDFLRTLRRMLAEAAADRASRSIDSNA